MILIWIFISLVLQAHTFARVLNISPHLGYRASHFSGEATEWYLNKLRKSYIVPYTDLCTSFYYDPCWLHKIIVYTNASVNFKTSSTLTIIQEYIYCFISCQKILWKYPATWIKIIHWVNFTWPYFVYHYEQQQSRSRNKC